MLRARIERLLEEPDGQLRGADAEELEEVVQLGLAAVHSGELWVSHVRRELDRAVAEGSARAADLSHELAGAQRAVAEVRAPVNRLALRAQELGVGAPRVRV